MSRRKRKNPIAYAAPVIASNYGFVCGGFCIGAIAATIIGSGAGYVKNAVDQKDANERTKDAKKDQEKQEKEQKRKEKETGITSSKVSSVTEQIAIRERLSQAEIASEREKTMKVDSYRDRVGLTGGDFDAVLNDLYAAERATVENVALTQLAEEQAEVDALKPPEDNTKQIALFSILGIATIGGLVYYKRQQEA